MRTAALAMPLIFVGAATAAADVPAIEHAAVRCIVAGRYPKLAATFTPAPVARARTYFRPPGIPSWYYVEMSPDAAAAPAYAGVLPKPTQKLIGQKIDYYVEAASPTFETARTLEYDPLVVRRPEECKEVPVAAYAPGPPPAVFPNLPQGFALAGGAPVSALAVVAGGAAAAGTALLLTKDEPSPAPPAPLPVPVPPSVPATVPRPEPPPPVARLEISCQAQPRQGAVPLRVLLAATAAGGTGSYDFAWTFGDGETSNQVTPGHTYAHPGTFEAVVLVTSGAATARCGRTIVVEPPVSDFTLVVSRAGNGAGTVSGPGIDCGTDCSQIYGANAVVSLTQAAAPGSHFTGWSGDCAGTGACAVTMDGPRNVAANFAANPTLQVSLNGSGTGSVNGPGIACNPDCSESHPPGTVVTLTATPATGATFAGWSGDCSGRGQCTVTMNGAVNVTATFDVAMVTLTVATSGDASSFVRVVGPGISCGTDCTETYPYGTLVTLTVAADHGAPLFTFPGWIGGGCSGSGSCQLTLTNPVSLQATFIRLFTLNVGVGGSGVGRVASADGSIDCPGTCTHNYPSNSPNVRLTAIPTAPSCFNSWTVDCSPSNPSPVCDLSMNANHSTTAIFSAVCISATGTTTAGVGAPSLNWSSQLEASDATGRVLGNGSDAGVTPAGVTQLSIPKRAGVNRVEAQLQSGSGKGGTWRFELLDKGALDPGSLRALEGEVMLATDEAIVFRVSGRAGERVVFSFRPKG